VQRTSISANRELPHRKAVPQPTTEPVFRFCVGSRECALGAMKNHRRFEDPVTDSTKNPGIFDEFFTNLAAY
jgi:hypothetical protein